MRLFLAASVFLQAFASDVGMNLPCNKELDGLLAADPSGNPSSFLSCVGVGVGNIGFWERKVCPNDMVFDFINQQCKAKRKKSRKQQTLNIAILNNSCANGETCIGGTVCDLDTLRCLCPYGTIPHIESLSCVKNEPSYGQTPAFNFNNFNFENFENLRTGSNIDGADFFKPNPNFQNVNNFQKPDMQGYSGSNSQWNFGGQQPSTSFGGNGDFMPNHKFVFNGMFTTPSPAPPSPSTTPRQKVPVLASPGQSCKNLEICSGGSICTLPIGLCLCPGELEAKDGECVLPASAAIKITKVGIGALCSDLAECDHGSSCVMGRCACVSPLIQHEGKCVLRQERKEVGPGELCDNGEVCSKGSVCDSTIPVCVCPHDTDLHNGECRRVAQPAPTQAPAPVTAPPTLPPTTQPPTTAQPSPTYVPPTYAPPPQPANVYRPAPSAVPFKPSSTVNYQSFATTRRPTMKPNHMKISLGGSKQAGVGVRCALNTDCMIGAYCNGNTNPPSCQCLSTHVNIEGRCEKIVYPGQIGCRSDVQCSAAYTGTSCIDRVCTCPEGSRAVDQTCISANEPVTSPPGGSCTEARECTGGSICREGWCICPDASMIVQKGICIQSGPRPTLPMRTVPVYTTQPPHVYQTAPPVFHPTASQSAQPVNTFNALPSPQQQSRKLTPGSHCGPLDSCVGGSTCVEGLCLCPAGMQPSMNGRCEYAATTTPPTAAPSWATRRPVDFIELPPMGVGSTLHALTSSSASSSQPTAGPSGEDDNNECEAIGLFCRGNTICVNRSCQCPDGYVLHNDGCVPPSETGRRKVRGKARHQASASSQYARPGESCDGGQVCTGGASCDDDKKCSCPREKPLIQNEYCRAETPSRRQAVAGESCDENTDCANNSVCHSGQCRCPPQFVAVSGHCVSMPMPTTPQMKVVAKPLESCDAGEECIGGASCDEDTGICMCPPGQIVFGDQCQPPPTAAPRPTQTMATERTTAVTAECSTDSQCQGGRTCMSGKCRCRPGTVDHAGVCEPLEVRRKPLKYGQPCNKLLDRCTNGASCIDDVCKCTVGFALSPNGWCERFNFFPQPKPKTFSVLPSAEIAVEPARPAWNVSETARPRWPNLPVPTLAPPQVTYEAPQTTATLPPTTLPTTQKAVVQVLPSDKGPRIRGRPAGASCRDSDICLHGSSCISGKCQCVAPLVSRNGHCVKLNLANPGDSCEMGEQCVGGSICDSDSMHCICAIKHEIVNGVCMSKDSATFVTPGASCSSGQICSGGSSCVVGTCQCDSEHYAEDGYCRHISSQSSQVSHDTGGSLRFSSQLSPRQPAGMCDPQNCHLPDCFCTRTGREPPLDAPIHDIPQFVVLTFDDAVNGRTLPDYLTLFSQPKYVNPNGCPVKATFFVSHEWTNYDAVQWLNDQGMEIASNSISHVNLGGENASRWLNEMDGQRRILAKFGNVPEEKITGMRAPQLAAGADAQFEMMVRAGFQYDNTLSANPGIHGEPFWPQTLDYTVPWNCHEENCPTGSFPGLWEIPLNQFYGSYLPQIDSYRRSSMIRAAVDLNNTVLELTNMLLTNFDRAYTSNKAPFVLSLNADFLQLNGRNEGMHALQKFLDEIMANKDVFLVTLQQLVEWMKNPLPMTQIHKSDALRCNRLQFNSQPRTTCSQANKCMYRTPWMNSYEHQMKTCAPCPDVFPWTQNPTGNLH